MSNKFGRTIRTEMPSELIPVYILLDEIYNSILNNSTFINQLKTVDYSAKDGDVWKELAKILKTYIYSKIGGTLPVKSWYARTIYKQLVKIFRTFNTQTTCYNAVVNVEQITNDIIKDLRGQNINTTFGNLRRLKDTGQPPQLPTSGRFELDLSVSAENCVRDIKDNTKITIKYAKHKTLDLDYTLPKNIRNNFNGTVSKPRFYKDKHDDYLGAVTYYINRKPVKRVSDRILGVDLGKLKIYSAVVLFENGSTSQEYVPSRRLDNLCVKADILRLENHKYKIKNEKVKPYLTEKVWPETFVKYENRLNNKDNNRQKIVNIKEQIAWQAANEIVFTAIQNNCSEIHLDYLKWLGSKGGKWNYAAIQERVELIAELYGIDVRRVETANSSSTHPITGEKGKYTTQKEPHQHKSNKHKEKSVVTQHHKRAQASNRKVKFNNGEIIDRDQLAATNHASRGKIQHEVKKINHRSSKRVRPASRKAEIHERVEKIKKNNSLKGTEIIVTDSTLERAKSYNNVLKVRGKAKHSLSPGHIFIALIRPTKMPQFDTKFSNDGPLQQTSSG